MPVSRLEITISNFDNAAMADNADDEVVQMLRDLIQAIQVTGIAGLDGKRLKESNGNSVGLVRVEEDND